ncbi:MAG: 2-phospho-L-lactate guanylyltransferase [Archaeoglobaceae archaeon]|uniref:2-phospho-L-lactate guanylyltransferase n=1 Tax=Archaeoglobus fulgidus TaxID=2234 RepID=A0A7J3M466_ARCFL
MKAVVPFKPINPKSRLAKVLSEEERKEFARLMLLDVLRVLKNTGLDVRVVTTSPIDIPMDVEIFEDQRSLDECINSELEEVPKAVVMSDLPLLNEKILQRFLETEGDVVIAPGRKGGTNMLLVRRKGFKVSYHYCSFLKHINIAKSMNFRVTIFDSFYSSVDVDSEEDLLELMIHGESRLSRSYLEKIGFRVEFEKVPRLLRDR